MKAYKKPITTIFKVELKNMCNMSVNDGPGNGIQMTRRQEAWDEYDE
ncbi:MAG: hypothetical protein HUK02_10005 [Bacteroidaceae bacterium]|nr:hypothetical protein [Bacteroidaceae bacterium]